MAQHNNFGEVFWMLQPAKASPRSKNYLIENLNGNILTTEAECLDCWAKHFPQLLNHPPPQGNDDLLNKPASNDYTDTCIWPVTEAEVAATLKHLKNGYSPDVCCIMAELRKAGGASLNHWLVHIINEVWIREELPDDWGCGIILPFWKHKVDIAPNGWEKMQLHELTQSMRQKDMKFVNCLNKIHTTVPLESSEEERMLQSHELKLNPNHENYPHDAMHVHTQNVHCDAWNENRLKLLPGKEFTNIATDSKKDDCTELANVTMPTNPHETGNLQNVLTVKINARVLITMIIDVTDGLTNGAMGTVTNVVIEHTAGKMSVILVAFDSEHVGQETRHTSVYNSIHQNAVPTH